MKTIKKIALRLLLFVLLLVVIAMITIWIKSPGTTQPITDNNGNIIPNSIATIEKLKIGNLDQYLIIRGENTANPVLLFLHGGPGSPEFPLFQNENLIFEKEFVMVNWEQRGAGKSYSENIPPESMTVDQLMSDIEEISKYLQQRFKKEKIYLAGHSWGSFIGMKAAYQYPELFHAYIGIGQAGNQYQGEQTSLDWIKQQAHERKNQVAIKEIADIKLPTRDAPSKAWIDHLAIERNYVNEFGGGARRTPVNVFMMFAKMIINAPEYTIAEKLHYEKANYYCMEYFWPPLMQTDLNQSIGRIEIPVYILQGKHDYQTPLAEAKSFFDQLDADEKEFFVFENSAHAPFLDEPGRFNEVIVNEVLKEKHLSK